MSMAITEKTKVRSQKTAFIEAARKAECDESEAAFDAKLKRIAKATPKPIKKAGKK